MKVATCLCSIRGNFRPLVYVNSCTHFWAVLTKPICSCGSIFQLPITYFKIISKFQKFQMNLIEWIGSFIENVIILRTIEKSRFAVAPFSHINGKCGKQPAFFQKVFSCCFAAKSCFVRSHLQNLLPRKNSLEYSAEFIIISSRFKIIWLKWPLKRPTKNIEIGQIMARTKIFLRFRAFSLYISCPNSTYFY